MKADTDVMCGYCGCGPVDSELHGELYGLLSEFYWEHHNNRSWQHCHEYAARIESLVVARLEAMLAEPASSLPALHILSDDNLPD